MIICVQRVYDGSVTVDNKVTGAIGKGIHILLGVEKGDNLSNVEFLANKAANLRIFSDNDGKMSLSVKDIGGEALVVSQFTLIGDTSKGNRPSFTKAAPPDIANNLYKEFIKAMKIHIGEDKVQAGIFAADMTIRLTNDGPVTILIEK